MPTASSLESRYRAIIEQAQDGLLVADARTGEIVDANPAVQQQLGFTLDELRGRSVLSVLRGPNDSQDPVIATLARVEPRAASNSCSGSRMAGRWTSK